MRKVFFETLTNGHRPWVAWYLARGWRVFVFDFTYGLKRMAWLRRLILDGRVERVYTRFSRADGMALDAAERLYPDLGGRDLRRGMGALFGREESDAVYKSALTEELTRYFFIRLYLEEPERKEGALLISESVRRWDPLLGDGGGQGVRPLSGIRQPVFPRLWSAAVDAVKRFREYWPRYAGLALYAAYAAARRLPGSGRRSGRPEPALRVKYLYAISCSYQMKRSGTRKFDFLLDRRLLTQENTAFLLDAGHPGKWAEEARAEGYRVLRLSDYTGFRSLLARPPESVRWGEAAKILLRAIASPAAHRWVHEATLQGLQTLVKESRFLEQIRFDHYIYVNQYGLVPRWRNVLLRKAGAQSWWFAYSTGGGFLYWEDGLLRGDNEHGGRHHYWAYQNPDHFVSPCALLVNYHQQHRQRIRFYHDVGNLWSELILQEERRGERDLLRKAWFGDRAPGRKVVAWFDTTFVDAPNSPSTFAEAAQWYADILRLAEEREDLLMVVKPSKDEGYYISESEDRQWSSPKAGRRVIESWSALRAHPRVRLLSNSEDPNPVILGSDLTVTFCFSAVSAEALGAGKRAIWYEPGQRWRKTLLGKDPMLTAHGYEELRLLVQKILYETDTRAYAEFLESGRVRGPVDSYTDGRGLSRFRELLAVGVNA